MNDETIETKRKRLHMRSIRRGIKEMDLILTDFATAHLATMSEAELDLYDALLSENDHDLYQWVSGQTAEPEIYVTVMDKIRAGAVGVTKP
ncbi:succinate dehydrogenase assembly factor 2 [Pseudooctadecabacter jejudonensis]|uniref:FAD assembly factor SdhE n=1 Tax=Pseudooctadecabacter jejudonensis TaxID=1391910 RepID=A0A1Y5RP63_9RHOB|nr:succinate dehydrogenase assembly factor 2 [Pseudooctadecabacter jejudonensis]SLN21773.1 Flavinator of succinate dehydrogenase [Pseudooctadecabacter jejudonensis]